MKHLPSTFVLICAALTSALPLVAESLKDAVADAERMIIQKYETPRARQMAEKDLDKILESDMTDEEKIAAIHVEFSSAPALSIPIQDKSALADNLASLIFRPPLQWTIHSIEIAYDIDSETKLLFSAESLFQEENSNSRDDSNGASNKTTTSKGAKTQSELDVGGDIKIKGWNPLNWFSAKAGYQWVTSGLAGIDNTKTKTSQWNERAQRALSNSYAQKAQILQNRIIRNCHLTFSISLKNNTDSVLSFKPRNVQIPIYADNEQLTYAEPETTLQEVSIFPNAYVDQMFRANLDNTKALKLIGYMCSHAPQIPLDRGQFVIGSEDGRIRNAILDSLQVETVPIRCRNMKLQIRKDNQDKPITVADAMHALNEVFEKAPFTFDSNGNCVALMDVPLEKNSDIKISVERLPVIEINGIISSAQIPSGTLNRPLSEDGIVFDIVNIVSDDEIEDVWENSSPSLQAHYVSCLKPVAEQGDGQAQHMLAMCYYKGHGVKQDNAEAVRWFSKSANQGVVDSQFMLGVCYDEGKGIAQNSFEAVKWFRKAADKGHAWAQISLGICYFDGTGVTKDLSEAAKMFRKAAEQGEACAQTNLGECYYRGNGVRQDYAEAAKWYRKAAEQGNARAQESLGECYYRGNGVRQDYAEAAKWYRKAAEQGNAGAQFILGVSYYNGNGVRQDYAEATEWYRKAAEQGNVFAQNNLGYCYVNGLGVRENKTEATKWYRKAAEQGNASAQTNLGDCYYNGIGVNKDYKEAAKWYRKAAEQGNAWAQFCFGNCCFSGNGENQDYAEAAKWYLKAAEQGNISAQMAIGACYEKGKGVPQDYEEAATWWYRAAEQGNSDAQTRLGIFYYQGQGVRENKAEAVRWFLKASDQDNIAAEVWLGMCYRYGHGVKPDINEAVKWLRKAANQGSEDAKQDLKELGY